MIQSSSRPVEPDKYQGFIGTKQLNDTNLENEKKRTKLAPINQSPGQFLLKASWQFLSSVKERRSSAFFAVPPNLFKIDAWTWVDEMIFDKVPTSFSLKLLPQLALCLSSAIFLCDGCSDFHYFLTNGRVV